MQEKPIALNRLAETRSALIELEQAIGQATADGDPHGLKAKADRLHRELETTRTEYLRQREWTDEPDFAAATSGGEEKPPREEEPQP